MSIDLTSYMVRLASDPVLLSEFIADPRAAATRAGLSRDDQAILFSGRTDVIYAALVAQSGRDPSSA